MVQFDDWCISADTQVGDHHLRVLTGDSAKLAVAVNATAAIVPSHYVAEEQVSRVLARLGKPAAAKLIQDKLPTDKKIRSGDLGELYATEWINSQSIYRAYVKRLRWKDHRNMALRGDDVIGLYLDPKNQNLYFLKTEAKSRISLTTTVLGQARAGLDTYGGLPSPHALAFISARLLEIGNTPLVDSIDDALLKQGIQAQHVRHLLFTFSGNAPSTLLTASLQTYSGKIQQMAVGLHVDGHADFISAVYDQVIANANNP